MLLATSTREKARFPDPFIRWTQKLRGQLGTLTLWNSPSRETNVVQLVKNSLHSTNPKSRARQRSMFRATLIQYSLSYRILRSVLILSFRLRTSLPGGLLSKGFSD